MKKTLTKSEMLELWRVIRTGEPLRLDCTVTRTDGADYDALLSAEMRAWYLHLLDCGAEELLAPIDMASAAAVEAGEEGLKVVKAPADVRRILRLRFESQPSAIAPTADEATVRACGANHFCRRAVAARVGPRTVVCSGVSGQLKELTCAMDFGEETYLFDDRALETISNQ